MGNLTTPGAREAGKGAAPSLDPRAKLTTLRQRLEGVLLGKADVIRLSLVGLLARGHLLVEDVPGVGKTTLARALARLIACEFRRIQFTPDLLPSDITGVSVFDQEKKVFVFQPGPIFGNIILADEINRTSPRTQSALLEAMNDLQVTVDGMSHPLRTPFMVIATQNPLEFTGTYPLPESQLDRFLMKIQVGYPSHDQERRILAERKANDPVEGLSPVLTSAEVDQLAERVKAVRVDQAIVDYMLSLVEKTRQDAALVAGVSPRGGIFLYRATQALAYVEGREYAVPDDVKTLAVPVLAHRVIERSRRSLMDGRAGALGVVQRVLEQVPAPQ
ncbi:MAG: MoxR family ATPase [Planctomycetota bacterium]